MAQEPEEDFEGEEESGAESSGMSGRKRLLLFVVAPVVLVIVAGAAAYFTGLADPVLALITGKKAANTATADASAPDSDAAGDKSDSKESGGAGKKPKGGDAAGAANGAAANGAAGNAVPALAFDALPDMLVNIDTASRQKSFLKLSVYVELASEADFPKLDNVAPRIVDEFQVYLRGLTAEDLRGAAGAYRLHEELLARVSAAVRPVQVKDVLFKEFIVQ